MAWREVRSLEVLAGDAIVHALVAATEQKVQSSLSTVSTVILLKHSLSGPGPATSTNDAPQNTGDIKCYLNDHSGSTDSGEQEQASVDMQEQEDTLRTEDSCPHCASTQVSDKLVGLRTPNEQADAKAGGNSTYECHLNIVKQRVLSALDACRCFWRRLPGAGPLCTLRRCLDSTTELHPRHDRNFPCHLTRLCLKLIFLEDVFVDRDYSDKDKMCVVPFAWEKWMCDLLKDLKPLALRIIAIYGAMYPSILESIVQASPKMKELTLSHINITDDLLIAVSRSCPKLEKLRLLHCYPWMVLSLEGFCSAFFNGQSVQFLMRCLEQGQLNEVELSFTMLKEIELSFGSTNTIREFHLLLLSFYKNLKFVNSQWKSNFFDDGYENYCEDVVQESISWSGSLSIDNIFLKADYLYDLTSDDMHHLMWNCPLLTELRLDCKTSPARSTLPEARNVGNKLAMLARENKDITSLYANVAREDRLTRAILLPFIVTRASTLTDLTLEACSPFETLSVSLIKLIVETCLVIKSLKVRVWTRSMVEFPSLVEDVIKLPERPSLTEVWLLENGPGESEEDSPNSCLWLVLINSLVSAAPNLHTLSITVCEGLMSILNKIHTGVRTLHVHIKDGYEWQPSIDHVTKLICHHPNLQDLYLEEISGEVFWILREMYSTTRLELHWGNLEGWPRS